MFAERLDILMELTGTTASALGKACALDPSHVSRLRRGSRPLPKKPAFFPALKSYFARRIQADYQKVTLAELMELERWPEDETQAAKMIGLWLRGKERSGNAEPILRTFTSPPPTPPKCKPLPYPSLDKKSPFTYYYGVEGKREAVMRLWSAVLRETAPQTLLLFSDEEMSWLYGDQEFAALWKQECIKVLLAGNRVRIIHATHRGIHEMLEGVAKWMPLYMTGLVEPYYYPKLRDDLFQRTLFIAPQTAALTSTSVDKKTSDMLHIFHEDSGALKALRQEYENLFALCRPLMQIITKERIADFWDSYASFLRAKGRMICLSNLPLLPTMPAEVARSLQARSPESRILEVWSKLFDALSEYLQNNHYTELSTDLSTDLSPSKKEIPLPFADLLGASGLCYTQDEYQTHRSHLCRLAENNKNYRQQKITDMPENLSLYGKENKGILLCKNDFPGIIFAFDEPNMSCAFWDYLYRMVE